MILRPGRVHDYTCTGMTPGVTRNERVLVGFTKIRLDAGERAVATVEVETNDLGR
jgi:hypothetical protein